MDGERWEADGGGYAYALIDNMYKQTKCIQRGYLESRIFLTSLPELEAWDILYRKKADAVNKLNNLERYD